MKSDIIISVCGMNQPRYDMFSRMLLHVGKTLFPVDGRVNGASHLQRRVRLMNNHAMFLLHMCHVHFPDPSGIRRLSAALRVKSGLGKFHLKSVLCRTAGGDAGLKFFYIRCLII